MPLFSHAIEEPDHEVIGKFDNVELRQYAPDVVAEVALDTTAEDVGSLAFPILAGYTFGKNKGEKKFAMTAPAMQTAAPMRVDMTAPASQAAGAGGMRVQFVTATPPAGRHFNHRKTGTRLAPASARKIGIGAGHR